MEQSTRSVRDQIAAAREATRRAREAEQSSEGRDEMTGAKKTGGATIRIVSRRPRDGYRYSVLYNGKLLIDRSRDPECDAARALIAQGITGKLTMLDGKTGKPRAVVDIEKAAKLTVSEEARDGLRFRSYRNPDISPPSAERDAA